MPNSISRRQFGLASTATLLGTQLSQAADDSAGWIDAHVHVWTPDTDAFPLDPGFNKNAMKPASFTPEELFLHTQPNGVDRIVLIQMSFYNFDNRYMLQAIQQHPGVFSGVGIVDHHASDVADKMRRLAAGGVKGFRLHSRGGVAAKWGNDAGMQTVWKTAQQEDLAVCPLINPSDLPHVDELCKRYPDTKVVVDHFARVGISGQVVADELDALCGLAKYPRVHVKTSAFYALGKKQPPYADLKPLIQRVVDAFGPERLMWASDCPYQVQDQHTYEDSIALIRDRCDFLSDSDKAAILRETAEKLFF